MRGLRNPQLLVTGFGPFPGVSVNPSAELVRAVAAARPQVATALLATEWAVAEHVGALAGAHTRMLLFGVAARSRRIRYERAAFPCSSGLPDGAGLTAEAPPPRSARTMFDVDALATAARAAGFPVAVSGSAGTYICNAAYAAALSANPAALFVHIPAVRPEGPARADDLARHALWLVDRLLAVPPRRPPARRSTG